MNERIKELAEQAGMIIGDASNFDMAKFMPKEVKFAELIVAHAIECVRDVLRDAESELTYGAADQVQKRIKQHFGVKE